MSTIAELKQKVVEYRATAPDLQAGCKFNSILLDLESLAAQPVGQVVAYQSKLRELLTELSREGEDDSGYQPDMHRGYRKGLRYCVAKLEPLAFSSPAAVDVTDEMMRCAQDAFKAAIAEYMAEDHHAPGSESFADRGMRAALAAALRSDALLSQTKGAA